LSKNMQYPEILLFLFSLRTLASEHVVSCIFMYSVCAATLVHPTFLSFISVYHPFFIFLPFLSSSVLK
jgi:hypothetical protein